MSKEQKTFTTSIEAAFEMLDKSQLTIDLLRRLSQVLKFDGDIKLGQQDNNYQVHFITSENRRVLEIKSNDPLFDDLYSCVVVRVAEHGGVGRLPSDRQAYKMV